MGARRMGNEPCCCFRSALVQVVEDLSLRLGSHPMCAWYKEANLPGAVLEASLSYKMDIAHVAADGDCLLTAIIAWKRGLSDVAMWSTMSECVLAV